MPLTDDDIDRMGDKVAVAVMKAFEEHRKADHVPLWAKMTELESKQSSAKGFGKGIMWMTMAVLTLAAVLVVKL